MGLSRKDEEALAKKYGALSEDDFHRGYVAKLVNDKIVRIWWCRYLLNGWLIHAVRNGGGPETVWAIDRAWTRNPERHVRDTLEEAFQFAAKPPGPGGAAAGGPG